MGLSRTLFLCTDMRWVKTNTNLSPFAVCYQVDSVIRSFFSDRCVQHEICFTSERWCFYYFVFALSANLIIWAWAFSAGTKASHSAQFIGAQTFHNIFVHFHVFINTFSKSIAVTWVFFSGNFYTPLTLKLFSINRDCNS